MNHSEGMNIILKSLRVQKVKSESLLDIYSANPRVNSVIRTLMAQYGKDELFSAVTSFATSGNTDDWNVSDIWELYTAAKWATISF